MPGAANRQAKMAMGDKGGTIKNAVTQRSASNTPQPIKNAVAMQPKPTGFKKVKNSVIPGPS